MQIHPDDATTTLSATIAALKCGQKPKGLHGGDEGPALHKALRAKGWFHGWALAVSNWSVNALLETARDASQECVGHRANTLDADRKKLGGSAIAEVASCEDRTTRSWVDSKRPK